MIGHPTRSGPRRENPHHNVVRRLQDDPFFREMAGVLKSHGRLLLVEPDRHVKSEKFAKEPEAAEAAGFSMADPPTIRGNQAPVLRKL